MVMNMNAFPSLLPSVLGLQFLLCFLLAVLVLGNHDDIDLQSEEESCRAPTLAVHKIGGFPVSTIVVVDDFLGEQTTRQAYEQIQQRRDWRPVIPDHQEAFTTQYNNNEDQQYPPYFIPPFPSQAGFPGIRTDLSEAYQMALREKLKVLNLEDLFSDVLGKSKIRPDKAALTYDWSEDSFFGNICFHPDHLGHLQRAPHVDEGFVVPPGGINREYVHLAIVHYISPDWTGTGGTSFVEEIVSGSNRFRPSDCRTLKNNATGLERGSREYNSKLSCYCTKKCVETPEWLDQIPNGYFAGSSTKQFHVLLDVPYKFDRVVIYSTKQLHTASLGEDATSKLHCNPSKGRLTANVFMV